MTDPQVAVSMLGLFLLSIFFGFPICFTLMAMAVFFGYYAYFDAGRMWRGYERALEEGVEGSSFGRPGSRASSTTASSTFSSTRPIRSWPTTC